MRAAHEASWRRWRWGLGLGTMAARSLALAATPPAEMVVFALGRGTRGARRPGAGVARCCAPREVILDGELARAAMRAGAELRANCRVGGLLFAGGRVIGISAKDAAGRPFGARARLVIGACGPIPVRVADADAHLIGNAMADATIETACAILTEAAEPPDDVRGSAEYRRLLIPRVAKRLIRRAIKKR